MAARPYGSETATMARSKSKSPDSDAPGSSRMRLVELTFYDEISRLVLDAGGVDEDEAKVLLRVLSELELIAERQGPQRAGDAARAVREIWLRESGRPTKVDILFEQLTAHSAANPSAHRGLAH